MEDARWMASALGLARRSLGRTAPNPAVGCILVRDGRVIGRGATAPGGRPHAETLALDHARRLGDDPRGATAYVSLEPCAHHGRTPPCAEALAAAGIARVVCPMEDPDPRVSGRGIAALKAAGIEIVTGVMEAEARALNAGFLSRIVIGRPRVVLKLAATVDGRIATRTGESRWITGPEARRRVHLMRASSDAILIGAGTARADDPTLDVREMGLASASPVRVVADAGLSLSLTSRIVASADRVTTWILHRPGAPADRRSALVDLGIDPVEVPLRGERLDMVEAMQQMGERGVTRLLCEGGGHLAASLLSEGLVDELVLFAAGKVIGGDGAPAIRGFGLEKLADAPRLELARVEAVGGDVMMRWLSSHG